MAFAHWCSFVCIAVPATRPRSGWATKRPYSPATCFGAANTLDPLPCTRLSRARTTTGPPPHFAGVDRRRVFPGMMAGADEVVPTFTLEPFSGVGGQLCPCNLAMATPQSFTVASRPATSPGQGVLQPVGPIGCALLPSPDLTGSSWWFLDPHHLTVLARAVVVRAASAGSSIRRLLGLQDRARTGRIVRVPP